MILQAEVFRFKDQEPRDRDHVWVWDRVWFRIVWRAETRHWVDFTGGHVASETSYKWWTYGLPDPEAEPKW
jgi:hypothetical protein